MARLPREASGGAGRVAFITETVPVAAVFVAIVLAL